LDSPKEELELLAKAKKYSDALVETERRSMRLVLEALGVDESDMVPEVASFKLSEGDQRLSREDKLLKAIEIMYDARYDSDKKNIMDPIAKFQRIMNQRLESELEAARRGTAGATVLQIILAFVIILAIAVLIRILFTQVTYPIRDYILKLKDFSFDDEEFRLVPKGTVELRPAIWMMPEDEPFYGTWPKCGEIDIMELLGHEPDKIYGTIHLESLIKNPRERIPCRKARLLLMISTFIRLNGNREKYAGI